MNVKTCCFIFVLILAALDPAMGQDRIELGWQTTRRGIVWYQSGKPTHQPTYRLSRDTNAVLWVDTLTALRYDWDYKTDRWRAKGTTRSAFPPLPQQASGSAMIDNTTAFWIRDTFNLLHKYDSTAQAWTPVGDFMYLSDPPTEIAASGSNGAAKYRRSLWQDADTYLVYYWDGSVWQQFGNASGGDNWGSQVAQTTARLSGDGTAGQPLDIAQQGAVSGQALKWNGSSWAPANDTDADLQKVDTFTIVSNTLRLSLERDAEPFKSVSLAPYLDNTDDQVIDTFEIVSNTLRISIEADGQPFKSVNLAPYLDNTDAQTLLIDSSVISAGQRFALSISGGNTVHFEDEDRQQIDTFSISGQVVSLSVQRDGQPAKTITLPTPDGSETIVTAGTGIGVSGSGTSGTPYVISNTGDLSATNEIQRLDTFEIVSNTLRASLLNDAVPFSSVDLSPYLDNTDDQKIDTFQIVSNVLRLSLESDAEPFKSVDLSPYVNVGTDLSYAGASSPVTLNSSTGNDVTHTAGTGISLAATSGNMTITNTAPDQTVTITNGGGISVSGTYPTFTLTASDQSAANEGLLGVGAGGANTATLLSNTTGQTPVTVSGSTGIGVSESTSSNGGTITVAPANDLAALEALASTGIAVRTGSETWTQRTITAGTGISVADGNGVSGNPTITATDPSPTNEAWTIDADDADTEVISNQTVKFQGAGTITTDYNPATDVLLITGAASSDGNGIYGDGTAGTGDDALPPGGSTVTIPGQWQPLNFAIDNSAGQVHTALKVTTDYCADDAYTKYLVGKSPSDSLEIYNFDCGGVIKQTGGILEVITDRELYLSADSINLSTVPARTIGASMLAMDGTGFVRKISGSSSGQILQWNGTNWALAAAPAAGITGAENGLTTVGSNVRLGGTLITTTIIGQAGFDLRTYGGKYGHSQYTGFSYSPTQTFGVSGYEGNPTTGSSPTADGIAEFVASTSGGSEQPNSLTIGALTTDNNGMWIQSRSRAVPNFYYPLLLQPNGGRFAVGRSGTTASHFTVTASGLTGSTASGMVGLFENSGGSGNVSVGFGAGLDAVSGQIMWNGTNDVMRIINRNGVSGTSKISFAIGGETSDRAHLIYTSTSPNARFSVGQTAANTHSTVQSGGSFATAFRQTTTSTTITEADRTVVYTLNSTVTFTLPSATGIAGREYIIHHFGSGGNISLSSSVISSTGTTFSAVGARQWAYIVSDGSNWQGYLLTSL